MNKNKKMRKGKAGYTAPQSRTHTATCTVADTRLGREERQAEIKQLTILRTAN